MWCDWVSHSASTQFPVTPSPLLLSSLPMAWKTGTRDNTPYPYLHPSPLFQEPRLPPISNLKSLLQLIELLSAYYRAGHCIQCIPSFPFCKIEVSNRKASGASVYICKFKLKYKYCPCIENTICSNGEHFISEHLLCIRTIWFLLNWKPGSELIYETCYSYSTKNIIRDEWHDDVGI